MNRKFTIEGAIAIYKDDELLFGSIQYTLLESIVKEGSINSAAKKKEISYQQAWNVVDKLNRMSPVPVVIRQKGGVSGGGCTVSEYGKGLIRLFEQKMRLFSVNLKDLNNDMEKCLF